jgi:AmmeMemoRadiSam system radical SAM enzyme
MPRPASALGDRLARLTREGELYEKLPNDRVRCFACGHRCIIPPGFDGVCRVRFNEGGELRVPWGYVGGVQVDPVEKKPFFHALPGSRAFSFGMLGCDFHCGYCFTGDTIVLTDRGATTLEEIFASCSQVELRADAEVAFPVDRRVSSGTGTLRTLNRVFRHPYRGSLVRLQPHHLPAVRCTPDHRLYATPDAAKPPYLVRAADLTSRYMLAIPRRLVGSGPAVVDVGELLREVKVTYRVRWDLTAADRALVAAATGAGIVSREIGRMLGKSASYVRHVRGKIARGNGADERTSGPIVEDGFLRFPGEHAPGIPEKLTVDRDLASLLGYYCAEGCVTSSRSRPNSHTINFSFSHSEPELVEKVGRLLRACLGLGSRLVVRRTTLAVAVTKASAALLFKSLAGGRSSTKRVPPCIAFAPTDVVRAFLDAYVEGDGHRYASGKIMTTTVSRLLAHGVAALALRAGYAPSVYRTPMPPQTVIEGRSVKRAPAQYTVVWYERPLGRRRLVTTDDYYLVPLRSIDHEDYDGDVYNMEVGEEHSYLAGFLAVANCQNWLTSQALRDPDVRATPKEISPGEMVSLAREHGARIMTSTYNEPLITSEWGMAVFREAKRAGLVCSYVSNGNATPEVLDYIQPWVSLYKVDLKSFRDRHYRELGGTLERVLWTIRELHARGFWLEIVTLVIPGFNDSDEELREIAEFLVSVSPDIPWHVTAFHKDYKMTDPDDTSVATLLRAAEIGAAAGLRFVYAGNLPGRVGRWENTYCPGCAALLIERMGYRIVQNRLVGGACPDCGRAIPGFWDAPA